MYTYERRENVEHSLNLIIWNVLKAREKHKLIKSVPPFIHRLLLDEFIPLNVIPYICWLFIYYGEKLICFKLCPIANRKFILDTKGGFNKPTSGGILYYCTMMVVYIYIDLDVELLKPSALLQYQYMHPEKENVFFEEVTLTEEETLAGSNAHRIRQGLPCE